MRNPNVIICVPNYSLFAGLNLNSINRRPYVRTDRLIAYATNEESLTNAIGDVSIVQDSGDSDTQDKKSDRTKTYLISKFSVQLLVRVCITPKAKRVRKARMEYKVHKVVYHVELFSTSITSTGFVTGKPCDSSYSFPFKRGYDVEKFKTYYIDLVDKMYDTGPSPCFAFSNHTMVYSSIYLSPQQSILPFRLMSLNSNTLTALEEGVKILRDLLQLPVGDIQKNFGKDGKGFYIYRNVPINRTFTRIFKSLFEKLLDRTSWPSNTMVHNFRKYMHFLEYALQKLPVDQEPYRNS